MELNNPALARSVNPLTPTSIAPAQGGIRFRAPKPTNAAPLSSNSIRSWNMDMVVGIRLTVHVVCQSEG